MTNALVSSELVTSRAFRRAVSFVIGVGVPALTALLAHHPAGMLVGAVTGMLFSFADEEGPLVQRLINLSRSVAGIAVGGEAGYLLGGYGPAFWLLFVVGSFAAAWLNRAGKSAHIGARLAVMAMTVAAGTESVSSAEGFFVAMAAVVTLLVRLADHAVFGPLPPSTLPPQPSFPESERFWLRFAAAYTAAAAVGLWFGLKLDPQHAIWVVVTTLVVMQPDDRANYRRILERTIGTLAGVAMAFVLVRLLHSEALVFLALVATAAVMPHHVPLRYWLHTAAIALLVLLAYDLASRLTGGVPPPGLFEERVVDVLIGCGLALVGTEFGFYWGGRVSPAPTAAPAAKPD